MIRTTGDMNQSFTVLNNERWKIVFVGWDGTDCRPYFNYIYKDRDGDLISTDVFPPGSSKGSWHFRCDRCVPDGDNGLAECSLLWAGALTQEEAIWMISGLIGQ